MKTDTIILGGGCFWCTESVFRIVDGITDIEVGYAGGQAENPTYEQVCTGETGHAEVIKLSFNTKNISLEDILLIFMATHIPTTLNRQGEDVGTQYRSIIFYNSDIQKKTAENIIKELQLHYKDKIVTEITELTTYFKAEEYHQNYYSKNPEQTYCSAVIPPKLEKLRKLFNDKMKF
ncbi:MAG: peptide-methionine (S)-S-oxide reductase MsrA [Tenacibaculum sp.]|nr:peptide-methionine (S)-S-oxide reductase MsrA [Tenacibaculum sp.]